MTKLAILGGQPVVKKPFLPFNTIGKDEKKAVQDVLDTGILSGFVGAPSEEFNGGKYVRDLENNWCEKFNTRYAVSVNSATSGLSAATAETASAIANPIATITLAPLSTNFIKPCSI